MKSIVALLAAVPLAAALATSAAAADDSTHTGTELVGTLDGKVEVPPGDPDGSGKFSAWVDPAKGRVCYSLSTSGIDTPTMAHIHRGAAGAAGPVAVPLTAPTHDLTDTCTPVAEALAKEIIANPGQFYVNVHTKDHPAGAIRAQLQKP